MNNHKKEMIGALKEAIKSVEKLKPTDEIIVAIIQYKTQKGRYDTDFHINRK